MDPVTAMALASGAASLINTGTNAALQNANNGKARSFAREQYDQAKKDNLAQWHMTNEYNSPQKQMERLQAAGLNPNLIYGKGADATASPMASNSPVSYNPKAPQLDIGSGLGAYMNTKLQNAQLSNLESQNTVLTQEAALKAATTSETLTRNARSRFDLDLATELRQTSADAARESLRQLQIGNANAISENERRAVSNDQNISESVMRIQKMREDMANTVEQRKMIQEQTKNIMNSNELQQLDLNLRRMGISPTDPMYLRGLGQLLNTPNNIFQKIDEKTRKFSTDFKNYFTP